MLIKNESCFEDYLSDVWNNLPETAGENYVTGSYKLNDYAINEYVKSYPPFDFFISLDGHDEDNFECKQETPCGTIEHILSLQYDKSRSIILLISSDYQIEYIAA